MPNKKQVDVTLRTIADISDVTKKAKDIQDALNKIQLPQKLRTNLESTFGDLYKEVEKASGAMAQGFKTKGDVTKYERSINNINGLLTKLYTNIQNIDSTKVTVAIDSKQLEEANKRITNLNEQLQTFSVDKIKKLDALFIEKGNPRKSKAASWGRFLEQMRSAKPDLALMEKALNTLNRELDKHKDKNGEVESSYVEYQNRVKAMEEVYNILAGKSEEVINIQKQLNEALNAKEGLTMQAAEKGKQNLEGASNAMKDLEQNTYQYGQASLDAAKNTQQLGSEIDQFKNRIAYFFGLNNAVHLFRRALNSAIATVKELDAALTETAVVTNFTVSDMWGKIPEYTKRANELGVTIKDVAEASTLYYQQGLKVNEVNAVTTATLKMARIAGLDSAEATDRMTNALRGFNMEINETSADRIADVYSKLAAISASNVDEISTAMTKTASLANNANMQFETTAAFLAQIIETTRESAETAGTALKTVIARFSEVKELYSQGELLGTDEEGEAIDVNKVSKALRTAGIDLNEYLTGMKGLDDIFLELASKWDSLDQVQQRYIATMAAGSRQQSRFIAMMQDYGRTQELVSAAQNAAGASQEQYQKTLDSLDSKLNKLHNSWNEYMTAIANQTAIKLAVDSLRTLLDITNKLTGNSGIAKLAVAFTGFKIGRNFVKNMFAGTKIGEMFSKKGQEAGIGFLGGLEKTIKRAKDFSFNNLFIGTKEAIAQDKALTALNARQSQYLTLVEASSVAEAKETTFKAALTEALRAQGYSYEETLAIRRLGLSEQELGVILTNQEVAGKIKDIVATEGLTDAQIKEKISEELSNKVGQQGLLLRLKTNALRLASILGINTETAAEEKEIVAKTAAKVATESLSAAQAKALIILGLYAAGVAALVGVIILLVNNSPEKVLERATKKAEESAEKANEAAEAYTNLKNSWEDLQDKQSTLDTLIKGTEEWKNGLDEVNSQVLNLIENFPKLAKYVSYDEKGMFVIDEKGYEQTLQEQQQERIDTARQAFKDRKNQNAIANRNALNTLQTSTNLTLGNTEDQVLLRQQLLDAAAQGKQLTVSELIINNPNNFKNLGFEENQKRIQKAIDKFYEDYEGDYGGTDVKLRDAVLSQGVDQGKYKAENKNAINSFLAQYHGSEENIEEYADAFNEIIGTTYEKFLNGTISEEEYKGIDTTNLPSNLGLTESQINDLVGQYEEIFKDLSSKLQQRNINGDWISDQTSATTRQNVFNKFDELDPSQQKVLDESIQKIYQAAGDKGKDFINQLFSKSTNWEDIDSLDNLETQLQELGIEVKQTDLTNLINQISQFKQAISTKATPEQLATNIQTQNNLTNKIGEGSNLTSDEKTYLVGLGFDSNNFSETVGEDGTIEYTTNLTVEQLTQAFSQANEQLLQKAVTNQLHEPNEANTENLNRMAQIAGSTGQDFNIGKISEIDYQNAMIGQDTFVAATAYDEYYKAISRAAEGNENLFLKNQQLKKALKEGTQEEKANAAALVKLGREEAEAAEKFDKLSETINNNLDALDENNKGTVEYQEAMSKVGQAMSDVFGQEFDQEFLEEHMEDIKGFAEGDEAAFNRLAKEVRSNAIPAVDEQIAALDSTVGSLEDIEGMRSILDGSSFDMNGEADFTDIFNKLVAVYGSAEDAAAAIESLGGYQVTFAPHENEDGSVTYAAKIADTFKKATKENYNNYGGGSKNKPKGGGSSSTKEEEKPKYWDNPYDELYNLLEEQNEALRTREKLEREYDRILKSRTSTAKELQQNSLDEIANLQHEIDLQNQLQSGRQRQMANLGNQYYRDSEGNARTFSSWGVQQYASYDQKSGVLKIDWDAIERVNDPDKGGAIEAYISKLEELSKSFEETQDSIEEMRDIVREIRERGMSEYIEFEQRIYDALVEYNQKIIDNYSSLADVIESTNSEILNSLRESIDTERQIRDNIKTEEDIADKEARLAYLQRDTSGANQQEILKLQQDLDNAREGYSDTLIDQMIEKLNSDNELANEQRAKQIEIMQAQLDYAAESGVFWGQVNTLLNTAFNPDGSLNNNSALVGLLAESDGFRGMSELGQLNWINDLATNWKQAEEGLGNWITSYIGDIVIDSQGNVVGTTGIINAQNEIKKVSNSQLSKIGSIFDNTKSEVANSGNTATNTGNTVKKISALTEKQSLFDQILSKNTSQDTTLSSMLKDGIKLKFNPLDQTWTDEQGNKYNVSYDSQTQKIKTVKMEPTKQVSVGSGNYSSGSSYSSYNKYQTLAQLGDRVANRSDDARTLQQGLNEALDSSNLELDSKIGTLTKAQIRELQRELGVKVDGIWGPETAGAVRRAAGYAYASGGLVDRTGPAWLDGTKSKPEMVLSARDTENFISLRDILSNLLKGNTTNNTTTGDNYYNIQIDAELSNDYDVDQLATRLKKQIYDDSAYRNVNAISYLR